MGERDNFPRLHIMYSTRRVVHRLAKMIAEGNLGARFWSKPWLDGAAVRLMFTFLEAFHAR